jgi:DNA-binding transcriptional LysR family regulator
MVVAEAGSMGKAAIRLSTAQPAVSRAIADLERAVGMALLERSAKGVELTKYGRALLDCATAVFNELRDGMKAIDFLADPSHGEIRIAGNEPMIAGLVPATFGRLRRRYPGVSIHVVQSATAAVQLALLRTREIDLVLERLAPPFEDDIEIETLFEEQSYVVAGASSPWSRRRKLAFSELVDEPWALPAPDSLVGSMFAEAFRKSGVTYPTRNVAFGHIHLHVSLAASGQFLAILPGSVLRLSIDSPLLKILPVACPVPPSPIGIMTLKNRKAGPVAQLFIEHARDVAKAVAKGK